jgi:hypothetical protein
MARINSSKTKKSGAFSSKRAAIITANDRRKVAGVSIGKRPGRKGENPQQLANSIRQAIKGIGIDLLSASADSSLS